jgi:hypothetical protein
MRTVLVATLLAGACGRIDFQPIGGDRDGGGGDTADVASTTCASGAEITVVDQRPTSYQLVVPGRFELGFTSACSWQVCHWVDLSASTTMELAGLPASSVETATLQEPHAVFYNTFWYTLDNQANLAFDVVDATPCQVTLRTTGQWTAGDGSVFDSTWTQMIGSDGHWHVDLVLQNSNATLRTVRLEFAYTNVRQSASWTLSPGGGGGSFQFALQGPSPHTAITVTLGTPSGGIAGDNPNNHFWTLSNVPIPAGGNWTASWDNVIWPPIP